MLQSSQQSPPDADDDMEYEDMEYDDNDDDDDDDDDDGDDDNEYMYDDILPSDALVDIEPYKLLLPLTISLPLPLLLDKPVLWLMDPEPTADV